MLCETEVRVLNATYTVLLADLSIRDATLYLLGKQIFTDDICDQVNSKPTNLERLRCFLQHYRRHAYSLDPLMDYFRYSGQLHLSEILSEYRENALDQQPMRFPPPSSHPRTARENLHRSLLMGGVPRTSSFFDREDLLDTVIGTLADFVEYHSFIVVLHGRAGSGKTHLASRALYISNEIIGQYYESVIWLKAGGKTTTYDLFADMLLMLRSEEELNLTQRVENVTTVVLKKLIANALVDKPYTLIVFDDVVNVETIKWAEDLGLRVLMTTRNRNLLDVATSTVEVIDVAPLSDVEATDFLEKQRLPQATTEIQHRTLNDALRLSCGNLALLTILGKMCDQRYDKLAVLLRKVNAYGLSSLTTRTPYKFTTINEALNESVSTLSDEDRDALAFIILAPPEQPLSLEIWSMIVPVTIVRDEDLREEVEEKLKQLCDDGEWLRVAENGDYEVDLLIHLYLRETINKADIKNILGMFENRVTTTIDNNNDECAQRLAAYLEKNVQYYEDLRKL